MNRKDYEFLNLIYDIVEDSGILFPEQLERFEEILEKIESDVQ